MNKEISTILGLIQTNNIDKAFQLATSLYEKNNTNLNLIKLLAYIYLQKNAFSSAVEFLKRGLALKPDLEDFDYFNNLGLALLRMEEYEEAIINLEKAEKISKDTPTVYTNFAEIYMAIRDFSKADEYVNIAISKIDLENEKKITEYISIFWMKSTINSALDKDDESVKLFLKLLDTNFNENIFYILSTIKPKSIPQDIVQQALNKSKFNNDKFQNKLKRFYFVTPLFFGLAHYYQKLDKKESEKYFHYGNKEIFTTTRYNSFSYQKKILHSMKYFSDNIERFEIQDYSLGKDNLFILGSPRSGTTLLESIVASNKEVFAGGELTTGKNLIGHHLQINNNDIKNFSLDFSSKYLKRTKFIKGNYKKIVDKMPENFLYLGYLLKFLPGCKVIRIFRNPWDTAISLYKQRYVQNIPYSSSFFNIAVFLANFEAINLFWDQFLQEEQFNKSVLNVFYEDLVSKKEENQEMIYKFLNLESNYDEEERDKFFSTTASMRQVKGGVHRNSIGKEEFIDKKDEFYESLQMQRKYWISQGLESKDKTFLGYKLA